MRSKFSIFLLMTTTLSINVDMPSVLAEEQKILQLDIDEVNRLALDNNFDIQVYRLDSSISEKELLKAQAVYDTELGASYEYDEDRLKRSSVIYGSRATSATQEFSLNKTLPTGTVLSLGASQGKAATDSPYSTLNPYHESEASISITQPLAKNALGIIDRNTVKISGLGVENATYTSLDKIEKELAEVQKAYWGLLLTNKKLDLARETLESARNLYSANEKSFDIGMVEPPELYAVEANLKEKESDLLLATDTLNSALNLIRLKLNINKDVVVSPKDEFGHEELTAIFEDILKQALIHRRDYKQARNSVKANDLYVQMKKNSLWPEIDLAGTIKKNGLDREFGKTVREISAGDYGEYTVGVTFSFPLENSTARAEYSQKELEKVKALVELKKTECLILVECHDAFIHARSIYGSIKLLETATELQHKKYLGEQDRFKKGRSDTDRLIRYQNDYLSAKLKYLQSLYGYKAALIDLKLAMNRLLREGEGLKKQ